MPAFAAHLSETDRWTVIQFVRTLAAADHAASLPSGVLWPPVLVAPDCAFEHPDGTSATLREQRGKAVVVLLLAPWPAGRGLLTDLQAAQGEFARDQARVVVVALGEAPPAGEDDSAPAPRCLGRRRPRSDRGHLCPLSSP
jgi:hypothetical protein